MNSNTESQAQKVIVANARQYSDSISKRRKALFKNEELKTHVHYDKKMDEDDLIESFKPLDDVRIGATGDYVILATIDQKQIANITHGNAFIRQKYAAASSEEEDIESSTELIDSSIELSPSKSVIEETPYKSSPTEKLKTPNETSSANSVVPKLIRKSLLDGNNSESCKRKINSQSPSSFQSLDTQPSKLSKIRTALFPDDSLGLPTKSFYPKTENNTVKRFHYNATTETYKKRNASKTSYLCNRSKRVKKMIGVINAGVGHKIRKPKRKVIKKENILKAAINIIENSPLNEYLAKENSSAHNEVISPTQLSKMDKILANIDVENAKKKESFIIKINAESTNKKRAHSPSNTNEKRKFFKSCRTNMIKVDKDLNIQVQNLDKQDSLNVTDQSNILDFSAYADFNNDLQIDDILNTLDDNKENKNNNINLMSPTSEMCDLTLSLAINSPKKAKLNINKILDKDGKYNTKQNVFNNPPSLDAKVKKFYSVFDLKKKVDTEVKLGSPTKSGSNLKKWKSLPKDQMLLDAGQKRFGVTQCTECKTLYHMGDPNDELMHLNYHNSVNILKYNGWKHENVVNYGHDYKIIKISPGDSKQWWKKVNDVLDVVNRDLGFYEMKVNTENSQIYFYIKNKQIIGCVVAEPISLAYKMLASTSGIDLCSNKSYSVKCGISRIWVRKNYRREKIATSLVNCLRVHFILGAALSKDDIAFSSPTNDGKLFASKYIGAPDFNVYM